ncbi:cytochrome b/b6 domain-containing protein [Desulfocurvus sp. DL9XJH121]
MFRSLISIISTALLIATMMPWTCSALAEDGAAGGTSQKTLHELAGEQRAKAGKDNEKCFSCHGKEELQWKTQHGRTLDLHVPRDFYARSVHAGQSCQSCHEGADAKAFEQAPHNFKDKLAKDCLSCHGKMFGDIEAQFANSVHVRELKKKNKEYRCSFCHDPHMTAKKESIRAIKADIAFSNNKCLKCHTDKEGFERLSGKRMLDQDLAHSMMLNKNMHYSAVRCVDCHSAGQGARMHEILPKKDSLRDCNVCHSEKSALNTTLYVSRDERKAFSMLGKGLFDDAELVKTNGQMMKEREGRPDSPYGFMNAGFLDGMLVIGATRDKALDGSFGNLLLAVLALLAAHACLRMVSRRAAHAGPGGVAFSEDAVVHPLTLRIWHWINALLILALLASGFSLHYSGGAGSMGLQALDALHRGLGVALAAWWICFLLRSLATGDVIQYWPLKKGFADRAAAQAMFYAWGIFRGGEHPEHATRGHRLNALQQITYFALMYVALPLLLISGLALFAPDSLPEKVFGAGGRQTCVTLHVSLAWLTLVFLIGHAYLATTGEGGPLSLLRSMFTGKPKGDD